MNILIASDHAGVSLKEDLVNFLSDNNYPVTDLGPFSDQSVDYPDFAHTLVEVLLQDTEGLGILICGSGNGVCMTANKYPNVRAALAWNEEIARLAKQHNNANILCLPARFMSVEEAKKSVLSFLTTPFEGGRHQNRVDKINRDIHSL